MKLTRFEKVLQKGLKEIEDLGDSKLVLNSAKRDEFIKEVFRIGGAGFVERLKKYAKTEKGEVVDLAPWYEEAALILGDLRIGVTLTTGSAQIGKTLINTFLLVDCLTTAKLNCAWFYDQATNLENNVPLQFKPICKEWIRAMEADGFTFNRRDDKQINTRYQVEGVNAIFSYVRTKTAAAKAQSGQAIAGSQTVSFQADIAFEEEKSQYPLGADDPIERRLDASPVLTHPIRELGTPGGGQGIELDIKKADRHFYPHYICPLCEKTLPLDPKGCVLKKGTKKTASGQIVASYLSEVGRPIERTVLVSNSAVNTNIDKKESQQKQSEAKGSEGRKTEERENRGNGIEAFGGIREETVRYWWYTDKENPVESAVICCSSCGCILDMDTRWNARLRCLKTGQTVDEFLADVAISNYITKRWKVGIHFSPLCRKSDAIAATIIRGGQDAENTTDWQQQALGHPSESDTTAISLEMIRTCIGLPPTKLKPDMVLCGLDFGRSDDWLVIVGYYLPHEWEKMRSNDVYEKTIRQVLFAGGVARDSIEEILAKFGVDAGLVDNEPDRESAIKLCDKIYNSKLNYSFNALFGDGAASLNNDASFGFNSNKNNLNLTNGYSTNANSNPDRNPSYKTTSRPKPKLTKLEIVDQKPGYTDIAKKDVVEDGGIEYPCWKIRRERFLNDVLQGFIAIASDGYPLFRLPAEWEPLLSVIKKSDLSPVQHLMNISKSFDGKTWEKKGKCDLYISLSLAEAAFYIQLTEYPDVLKMLQAYQDRE